VTMSAAQIVNASFVPTPPAPAPTPKPAAKPAPKPTPPVSITQVRLSTHTLRLARGKRRATKAQLSLRLSRAATLTVTVEAGREGRRRGSACVVPTHARRKRARCTRYVALSGHQTVQGKTGSVKLTLATRFAGRTLKAGSYRLSVIARDSAGNRVGPVTAAFAVKR
jgi:hypothetical protein